MKIRIEDPPWSIWTVPSFIAAGIGLVFQWLSDGLMAISGFFYRIAHWLERPMV